MALNLTNSRAIERAAICALLRTIAEAATVTYTELDAAAGCDVRKARHLLMAAREDVRDEDGIVFEPINLVGLRRLTQIEMATVQPDRRRRRSRNQSMTALKEMAGVQLPALPPGERTQFIAHLAQLSAIAAVATHRAFRRLMGVVPPDAKELPIDETLAALREIK